MKYQFLIAAALVSSLFLNSCKKDDTASAGSSNVTYQITTTDQSGRLGNAGTGETIAGRIADIGFTWTDGYITTSEIKFEAKGDNKVEFKSEAIRQIDLFDAIATIGNIAVIRGTYEKIEFKTKLVPAPPYAAFELKGLFIKDGVTVPVVLRFDKPIEFKFEKKTPTVIDANAGFSALNTLDLDLLSSGITVELLNNAVLVNGTIDISSTSNITLFNIFWKALEEGVIKVEIKKN